VVIEREPTPPLLAFTLMSACAIAADGVLSRPDWTKESRMPPLMREVVGDVLRGARMSQGRTLREVSDSARVSLGYLSEVERGRKEPSSELLNAICDALEVPLSAVLTDAGERMASEERADHHVPTSEASGPTIDASTKVVIPPVASLAVA
jgi:XRE family transcriptional regulator, stress-response regulator